MRRKRKKSIAFIPFSKKLLEYSRYECWIMTIAIFVMQGTGIDTDDLYQVVLAGWTGYGVAKALYYNMAKSDHQIQLLKEVNPDAAEKVKEIITEDVEEKLQENISEEITTE